MLCNWVTSASLHAHSNLKLKVASRPILTVQVQKVTGNMEMKQAPVIQKKLKTCYNHIITNNLNIV